MEHHSLSIWEHNSLSIWERNAKGEYLQLTGLLPLVMGLEVPFCPSLKLMDKDLPKYAFAAQEIAATCDDILKGSVGALRRSTVWTWVDEQGWVITHNVTRKTEEDTIVGECQIIRAKDIYPQWYPHLDFENKRLWLPAFEIYISTRDMQLLRMLLMGLERKVMADRLFVSVGTIEKRLTAFRSYRIPSGETFGEGMANSGLSSFLLGSPDWFSSAPHQYIETQK